MPNNYVSRLLKDAGDGHVILTVRAIATESILAMVRFGWQKKQ